jgi:hypothetical protein
LRDEGIAANNTNSAQFVRNGMKKKTWEDVGGEEKGGEEWVSGS